LYAIDTYTVTFMDYNGTILEIQTVNHGSAATAPIPTREGYTFTGWDNVFFSYITSNLTVTAYYTINSYTVTFVDYNGATLETQTVNHGSSATAPYISTRDGYTFTGWDVDYSNVTSNLTVKAEYTINTYTVIFADWNGTVLKTQPVNHNSPATAPTAPARTGYTFTGWDADFTNVTSDLTVTATYEEIPTPIHNPTAKSTFAIVQTGEILQIAGISQPTPIRIHNMQGKALMTRTAMPNESISISHLPKGVYVVKAGGETVKVVR